MKNNRGFIGKIILVIIAAISIKYFLNFDIVAWLKSPTAQEIIQPTITFFKTFWAWLGGVVSNISPK